MNELNRHTLRRALRRLRSHQPSEQLWSRISEDLDQPQPEELQRNTLREGLTNLPTYRAPGWLWDRVAHRLERRGSRHIWLGSMAAAVALLAALGWVLWPHPSNQILPAQASERRPSRELVIPEGEQADFLQHLNDQEKALLDCISHHPDLSPAAQAQWQQIRAWALQTEQLPPRAADSLIARRRALVNAMQAELCP
jgi:hypothetical protein